MGPRALTNQFNGHFGKSGEQTKFSLIRVRIGQKDPLGTLLALAEPLIVKNGFQRHRRLSVTLQWVKL